MPPTGDFFLSLIKPLSNATGLAVQEHEKQKLLEAIVAEKYDLIFLNSLRSLSITQLPLNFKITRNQ